MWSQVAAPTLLDLPYAKTVLAVCVGLVLFVIVVVMPVASVMSRRMVTADLSRAGLYGVVGRFGSGKSLLMAWMTVRANKSDRQVLANFDLLGASRYVSWLDLMWQADDGALILLDEATLWWPPGNVQPPALVDAWIRQLRKRRITMVWASQDWPHVGKRLRDLTFACWRCRHIDGHHVYTLHERDQMARKDGGEHSVKIHVRRTKDVMAAYSTFELVEPGGWADVPESVTVESFLTANGRTPINEGGQHRGWTAATAPVSLETWLASLPEPVPARRAARRRSTADERPVAAQRRSG